MDVRSEYDRFEQDDFGCDFLNWFELRQGLSLLTLSTSVLPYMPQGVEMYNVKTDELY